MKELGFQALNEQGVDYDNPGKKGKGDDTIFCLTFDKFTDAMRALDEKMRTSPIGLDSRMESGLTEGTVYYGKGEPRSEAIESDLELKPVLNHKYVEELLDYIDEVRMIYERAGNKNFSEPEWILDHIKRRDVRDPLRVKQLTALINARFGAGEEDYRNVSKKVTLGAEIMNSETTSRSVHPSKSTLHIYNEDTQTLQTKRIFLVKDDHGKMQRVEVYSREVYPAHTLVRLPSGEYDQVLNFRAAEVSESVALLQYVETHNVEVLGWMPFE